MGISSLLKCLIRSICTEKIIRANTFTVDIYSNETDQIKKGHRITCKCNDHYIQILIYRSTIFDGRPHFENLVTLTRENVFEKLFKFSNISRISPLARVASYSVPHAKS